MKDNSKTLPRREFMKKSSLLGAAGAALTAGIAHASVGSTSCSKTSYRVLDPETGELVRIDCWYTPPGGTSQTCPQGNATTWKCGKNTDGSNSDKIVNCNGIRQECIDAVPVP